MPIHFSRANEVISVSQLIAEGRAFLFTILLLACQRAYSDVGLVVENPTGPLGFFSDVGHASVWISHGCLGEQGEIRYCEHSRGIVLTSTSYWPNPGVAAIPAELFFLGTVTGSATPATWDQTLAAAYPQVSEEHGRKYLGRVWRRETNILVFATSADEDRVVLETHRAGAIGLSLQLSAPQLCGLR